MHLTVKQLELLRVINAGNSDGSLVDLDEVIDRINYETTKASIQFSIRALLKHGLIEKIGRVKRRGRQRVLIGISATGRPFMAPSRAMGPSSLSSKTVEDELLGTAITEFFE